jgi:uncharacterized protein DUF6940
MWDATDEILAAGSARRYVMRCDGSPLSYGDAVRLWRDNAGFRSCFTALLADAPYSAFRWEAPPLTLSTASRPFEFVLLDAPGLERSPDADAFADHLTDSSPGGSVAAFPNLGNDAVLVVPRADGPPQHYTHLAAFVRGAPPVQQHALWRAVGAAVQARLGPSPMWLSTAGAGVAWLHVRLDSRPKYYGHRPYAIERPS